MTIVPEFTSGNLTVKGGVLTPSWAGCIHPDGFLEGQCQGLEVGFLGWWVEPRIRPGVAGSHQMPRQKTLMYGFEEFGRSQDIQSQELSVQKRQDTHLVFQEREAGKAFGELLPQSLATPFPGVLARHGDLRDTSGAQ